MSSEIVQSSKFSVEFIWFISMLITNDAFLILSKLLVLSIAEMRHTAQMSHTAHTTRLYKCHTAVY
jgi:hypothetical protein